MLLDIGPFLVIYGILLLLHLLVCGVLSLAALVIAELSLKRKLRFLPFFLFPFLAGGLAFVLAAKLTASETNLYVSYATVTLLALAAGIVYSRKQSKQAADAIQGGDTE